MPLLYCGEARLSRNKIRYSPGVDLKLGGKISARLTGFGWITTHFPIHRPGAQDNWRITSGFVFHLGRYPSREESIDRGVGFLMTGREYAPADTESESIRAGIKACNMRIGKM